MTTETTPAALFIGHTDPPDHEAHRARKALADYKTGVGNCFAAIVAYGSALREGRAKLASDKLFGKWVENNKLDQTKPFDQQQERTQAMRIAEILTQGTATLGSFSDSSHSVPTNIMKWWRRKNAPEMPPKPETQKPSADDSGERVKLTQAQERLIEAEERLVEARIKARKKELEKDFAERVRIEVDQRFDARFPDYENREMRWREMFKSKQYSAVKRCCDPNGEPSQDERETAFHTLLTLEEHLQIAPKKAVKQRKPKEVKPKA